MTPPTPPASTTVEAGQRPDSPPTSGTVLVTSRSFSSGSLDLVGRLEQAGLTVTRGPANHDLATLQPALARATAWIAGTGPVTAEHLSLAPQLRILARYGVGTDAVDLSAAAAAGIPVSNTPGANSEAVAEHALALALATLRGVPAGDRRVRAGDWSVTRGRQVAGSTAGVIGFGRIGRAVAARLAALGCTVLVHDPYVPTETIEGHGHRAASLPQICAQAGIVSLHLPGGEQLIDREWVEACAPGQVLVNTARAGLVDEEAVAAGLRSGRLSGYAADTLSTESVTEHPSALLDPELADRVVLTPHLGAQTVEAVDLMGTLAVDNVLAVLAGQEPIHPVGVSDSTRAEATAAETTDRTTATHVSGGTR